MSEIFARHNHGIEIKMQTLPQLASCLHVADITLEHDQKSTKRSAFTTKFLFFFFWHKTPILNEALSWRKRKKRSTENSSFICSKKAQAQANEQQRRVEEREEKNYWTFHFSFLQIARAISSLFILLLWLMLHCMNAAAASLCCHL